MRAKILAIIVLSLLGLIAVVGVAGWNLRAIARSVEDCLETEVGRLPLRREGQSEGRWVLLDYGELIIHVLTPQERSYYDLEAFWGHGEQIRYISPNRPAAPSGEATPLES